jgi:proteasome lid subunit RPN8/RPN11
MDATGNEPLKLPKQLLAEMITHALDKDPEECCGLLVGRGDSATRLRRIRNVHESLSNRFSMDPLDVIEAERDADGWGEEFVAIYHSHTYSQGYPSDTDVRNATENGWTDPFYVLISLVEKTRPVVRAYRISGDGEVAERFIRVLGVGGYTSGTTPPGLVE